VHYTKGLVTFLLILSAVSLEALSLKEALVESLETNPKIKENLQVYKAAKEDLEISTSLYYPTLDLKAGAGYQDISNSNTGFQKESDDIYETSLLLRENLFDGFTTTHSVSSNEARLLSASYNFIEKANETAFETLLAFINVLKEKELRAIALQNIQINNRIFNKVHALFQTGMVPLSEQEKIESSLSLARSNYFVSQNNFRDAKRNFERLLGRYVSADELENPSLELELPLNQEEALAFCYENNPSLRVSQYELIAAQEEYKLKQAKYYPNLDAEVRQAFNSNLNGIKGDEDDFRAMLVLSYNLFNGGADKADIQKRQSIINQEMAKRADIKRRIKENFSFAWNAIEELHNQAKHLQSYKKHSVKTLMLHTDEYDMGKRSILDLLASQNDLISAKRQIVSTRYQLLSKQYELLNIMSIMVPAITQGESELYAKVKLEKLDSSALQMDKGFSQNYAKKQQAVCQKTLSQTVLRLYGCEEQRDKIRRFSEFNYECKTGVYTPASLKRLKSIVAGLKKERLGNKTITIISHVDTLKSKEDNLEFTQKQNEWMKNYLRKKGLKTVEINTISKGSEEPLWLDESTGFKEQNCRTDIVIKEI